jgi:hypothetical protein
MSLSMTMQSIYNGDHTTDDFAWVVSSTRWPSAEAFVAHYRAMYELARENDLTAIATALWPKLVQPCLLYPDYRGHYYGGKHTFETAATTHEEAFAAMKEWQLANGGWWHDEDGVHRASYDENS